VRARRTKTRVEEYCDVALTKKLHAFWMVVELTLTVVHVEYLHTLGGFVQRPLGGCGRRGEEGRGLQVRTHHTNSNTMLGAVEDHEQLSPPDGGKRGLTTSTYYQGGHGLRCHISGEEGIQSKCQLK